MPIPKAALVTVGVTLFSAAVAQADGAFFQGDIGKETRSLVGSVVRGNFSYGFNASAYESGHSGALSLGYRLPFEGGANIKIGPSVGFTYDRGTGHSFEPGVKLVIDRYQPTSFGAVYVLGEASSVHDTWFAMAQFSFAPSGLGLELSRGGSDSYRETTVTLQKRLTDTPYSLRLGYKTEAQELFLGFSINTF